MVVNANPGIESQPKPDVLPEIHVTRNLVLAPVHKVGTCPGILSLQIFRPCLSAITEPVKSQRDAVSLEESRTLIKRNAHHVIKRVETSVLR